MGRKIVTSSRPTPSTKVGLFGPSSKARDNLDRAACFFLILEGRRDDQEHDAGVHSPNVGKEAVVVRRADPMAGGQPLPTRNGEPTGTERRGSGKSEVGGQG